MRIAILMALATAALAQKYTGPVPEKADLPYIVQADNLIATEGASAQEEKSRKDEVTYVVTGAASSTKTPLASPIFLLKTQDLAAEKLQLYKLDVKNGRREITFRSGKRAKNPEPLRMNVTRVSEGLFKLEVSNGLPNGEYSLTPEGSDRVFCFSVF